MDPSAVVSPSYVGGPLRLVPFRALTLSPDRIGHPSATAAFARPYRDVADRMDRWQRDGLVLRDAAPAVYLHEYVAGGVTVRGLVGALDVSRRAERPEDRVVFPHEGIHPEQAGDLADRMAEMKLNPAPILLAHRATPVVRAIVADLARQAPVLDLTDGAGQVHRVWALRDAHTQARLDEGLAGTRALIADGHHRYAAYLRLHQRTPGGAFDLGLAMLVDHDDTPLELGAIHRVLHGTTVADVRAAAERIGGRVTPGEASTPAAPRTLVATDGRDRMLVELPSDAPGLAVEVVHALLLPALARRPDAIGYHHSDRSALGHAVPAAATALLLPAPDVDGVLRAAAAERLLPEKATSFQPKPSVGVLMRSLLDG